MLLEEVTSTPMRHSVSYPRNYHHSPPVNWQKRFDSQMQDEATSSEDETTNQTRSREGSPETFLNSITRGFQTSKGLLPSLRTHYGEIPQDRPLKEQFNLDGQPQGPCSDPSRMHASLYVIERYYGPCVEAIDSLRAMTISGLRLGTHHKGRKLLAKVVGTSMIVNGIQTIIEDRKGDVVTLVICHPPKDIEPEDLLPLNALIIIKQPMFEVWPNGDGGLRYDIRVDHLSDLIIKMNPQYDSQLNTLDSLEWKERGDLDMEHQDKWSAVACYTQGIKLLDEASFLTYTARELYSSRAMAYTGRDQHEVAYYDACKACDIDANIITPGMLTEGEDSTAVVSSLDARALLRRARALYAMHEFQGSYETCRRALEDRCTTDDELIDTLYTLYQRAISRWFQSENGFYNWKAIRNAVAKGQIHNDIASYLKPIEVQNACGMGRGLFAKHNVAKGAMVLAEKAFAYAKGEPRGQETHIHVIYDLTRDAPEISAGEALLEKALTALQGMGPEWRSRFFELHSGGYDSESGESTAKAPTVDDQLIIDTFHVLSILRLNSMSCGPPHEPDRDSGIWVQASYVNHSCDPNCEIAFYGDMLVIRALRDIKVGEQITLNYVPMDVSNKKRREVLKASWAFDCGCGSCT